MTRRTDEARALLDAPDPGIPHGVVPPWLGDGAAGHRSLALLLDHTLLAPEATATQIAQLAADLDADLVLDVISKGAAQSWQMENRGKTMHARKFDFGFAVDWMRKDLGLALDEARVNGATLPVASIVDQFYADVQKAGGGRKDTSSLVTRLPK